jgi:superfamily II DNA or RNA helicase
MRYEEFIERKRRTVEASGFDPGDLSPSLFPFQRDLTAWALRQGRAAIFASTGLGKTRMEIEWARCVVRHTGGRVLILAPLAVAPQTVAEGAKIGVSVRHCRDGAEVKDGITVTNYDRLHRFDPEAFAGVVLDESSCIKHQNSKTLASMLEAFGRTPYRLSATATPAPNDYTELGTQAEFLGVATRLEMLSEFFVHDGGETQVWRLKRHARRDYWRWVASWAALVRRPSDLGCDDAGYDLPELTVRHHVAPASQEETFAMGRLFAAEAGDLSERRAARRGSIGRRVEMCAEVVNAEPSEPWIVWCDLNAESEALARAIPGAVEVRGSDDIDEKERRLTAFATGGLRVLVTKPSIAGHGLNLQRCARVAFVGVTDSWELYHQAVRRVWRFGQSRPVDVHVFASEAEGSVLSNLERKEADAAQMAEELSAETRDAVRENVRGRVHKQAAYVPRVAMEIPEWLGGAR